MTDLAPSENFVQQEALQFNQPVSEASAASIGALANALRQIMLPVASIIHSFLDEATFQQQNGSPSPERWIIADGRSVAGSKYETLTGSSTVPDLRGIFLRGKNYGRSGTTGNPDGDLPVGTYTTDRYGLHGHGISDPGHTHILKLENAIAGTDTRVQQDLNNPGGGGSINATNNANSGIQSAPTGIMIVPNGSAETSPRNSTVNIFIRIN